MRRGRRDIDVLKRIVEVRELQERVSEQAFADAAVAARAAREAEGVADRRLAESQEAWMGALRQARFDPQLMGAFTEAVNLAGHALVQAKNETVQAGRRRDDRRDLFRRAEADTEAAEQVRDAVQRTHRRRHEEARLSEVSDSVARRRSKG